MPNFAKMRLAVIDCETDPFAEPGETPYAVFPFSVGFYCAEFYQDFWGDDCIERMMEFLADLPDQYLIFAHNGGKFDFAYFFRWVENPIVVIKSRLVRAKLFKHYIQDSYKLLPFSLATYQKTEIDYAKFKRGVRDRHRDEILRYLRSDCVNLHTLVSAFLTRFGYALTIGRVAIDCLQAFHPFPRMHPNSDIYFREFYFGGRVECFRSGNLNGPYRVDDVNSMYPFVMAERRHPIGNEWTQSRTLPPDFEKPYFCKIVATSRGALPLVKLATKDIAKAPERLRAEIAAKYAEQRDTLAHVSDGSLCFPHGTFTFNAISHEIEIALLHGLLDIHRVVECYTAKRWVQFDKFVYKYYEDKKTAKANGDKEGELFAKFLLNNSYGKAGQNPENYKDYKIVRRKANGDREISEAEYYARGWSITESNPEWELWHKDAVVTASAYYDVSIAASVTSAARAVLLDALQHARDPIYCDTDSLISRGLDVRSDDLDLGAWKHEFNCDVASIAGKKLYALYNKDDRPLTPKLREKVVSKGGTLTRQDVVALCNGGAVEFTNPVPTFQFGVDALRSDHKPVFIRRTFRATANSAKRAKAKRPKATVGL